MIEEIKKFPIFKICLMATRPKTLPISICPVLIGSSLAITMGSFRILLFLSILLTALGIQILANLVNDYFDFVKGVDSSARKGPIRVMQSGLMSQKTMKNFIYFIILSTSITVVPIIVEGGLVFILLFLLSIFLAIAYTMGPFSLSYLGIGEPFTFLFFGPIAVFSTFFLYTHQINMESIFAGVAPGLFSAAILNLNNMRDVEEDKAASKKTLAVRYGLPFVKTLFAFLILTSCLSPLTFSWKHPFSLLSTLTIFPAIFLIREVWREENLIQLNQAFGKTIKLLSIYTFLFCIGWML
ncbi:MAG: 1,4-dihydroxy-2-naphthoate octaprenyltransferase [Chlamydiae bacterium]|nr:1,4-dihydroxy-2-naphthoate octaprenyltransferase [Chlamydiota bacterium]